jgi:UDP-N-acetylmuramoyl-L-alanyl-D-glutamate--2,6-diaminopimelate ligase
MERQTILNSSVPGFHSPSEVRKLQAFLKAREYDFPARKLKLIGVTGTNGKTSVCHYTAQMLEEAGRRAGIVTTVGVSIGGQRLSPQLPWYAHKFLDQMVKAGCDYAVLEATSCSLELDCFYGVGFEVCALTNLTPEHFELHGTMENYRAAKEKLFATEPKASVVNAEDPSASYFLKYNAGRKLTFGLLDASRPVTAPTIPDVAATALQQQGDQTTFLLSTPFGADEVCIPLFGRHTVANVLAAVAICLSQGVTFESITQSLSRLRPPEGRLQRVDVGQPFSVFVDYAHNPDGLQQVLSAVRPMAKGRLIAVLGAGGDRYREKRPILGALAVRYADYIIVTSQNPRSEDPMVIIDDVAEGIARALATRHDGSPKEGVWWWRIEDRREAIARALSLAREDDIVLVTGHGGENEMSVGKRRVPFNDVEVVKELLSGVPHEANLAGRAAAGPDPGPALASFRNRGEQDDAAARSGDES